MFSIKINNLEQTQELGVYLGKTAQPSNNIILSGDLGAGKTTLTKGIGQGIGIKQMIKSPTYTIIREYEQGRMPLYHMDVYRVQEGIDELGLDDYFEGNGLSVIEWGEMLGEELPEDYLKITIEKIEDTDKRIIYFEPKGKKAQNWYEQIQKDWKNENE
ncbi:MAG: tRNA (adenosine(37)-N6)-threonylcarbamoyltransferase complex ATPase subunit type 1 TsaE [Streptococcaceae bacterium]|jgi:tRNA threonylcarbamoyladenosine biosynthesis protein TsaE|nr:tRNA (adenosine(37)-N6)-threonylcarbamoyltransferase complex ATPase subunit type 1 TsaE [Streptococcaceae bacterium]